MDPNSPRGFRLPKPPPPNPDVLHRFFPLFQVYKDGRIERFLPSIRVPPADDSVTGVQSKDVVISSEYPISARIFLPKVPDPTRNLPLLVYIHGGGFSIGSAFSELYHGYVSSLSASAGVICVSVEYRLAPEHHILACYDDCWEAFRWVASHASHDGPDPWLNAHADFQRVYVGGDSAGGNLAHDVLARAGSVVLPGIKIVGAILVHPFFGTEEGDKMWLYLSGPGTRPDDPKLKPDVDDLKRLGCENVLILVAEKDPLRERGKSYYEALMNSGWKGTVEIEEHEGEGHVFHLFNPGCDKAVAMMNRIVSFINVDE